MYPIMKINKTGVESRLFGKESNLFVDDDDEEEEEDEDALDGVVYDGEDEDDDDDDDVLGDDLPWSSSNGDNVS